MGTSKSSTGPGPGVPFVSSPSSEPLAPARRFVPARTYLGHFMKTGSLGDMQRALGHYVCKGYGGTDFATQRMDDTVDTAGELYAALTAIDPAILPDWPVHKVAGKLVEIVRPIDGTLDAQVCREAISRVVYELHNSFPHADFSDLAEEQRLSAIEHFVSLGVCGHLELDLGITIQGKAPSSSAALARREEMRDHVKQTVSNRFRSRMAASERLGKQRVSKLARQALRDTFQIFEDYLQ